MAQTQAKFYLHRSFDQSLDNSQTKVKSTKCGIESNTHLIRLSNSTEISQHNSKITRFPMLNIYSRLKFCSAVLLTATLMCIGLPSNAQSSGKISVGQDGIINLPTSSAISETYLLDLSKLNFKSEEELNEFLQSRSNDHYFLRTRSSASEAILIVNIQDHPEWTPDRWREQIKKESQKSPLRR